ncbi:MAG TPA: glutamate synthase subunit beta [Xanthobacteraceae bacterium]|nr:glutamate synthase subunit beta [Xanthobacteraceae bacterium]
MGKVTGFLEYQREDRDYEAVQERVRHWREFVVPLPEQDYRTQAARCMNCGVPFCQGTGSLTPGTPGCPVNNQIPDWNDLVYAGNWDEAARNLHSTNNFPEVTGRVCPAPCEASCTLNIDDNPVTIKSIECAIADRAIAQGLIPEAPSTKTGKTVAVVGSGPAGLACAQQLARAGHSVHVYEKYAKAGGLLRYGIPDFKMEKSHVDRRVTQMEAEGVVFHYGAHVGVNLPAAKLLEDHDALVLTGGAEKPRDLPVPGRELKGVHFAMDFLPQQNRRLSGEASDSADPILANGKHVVVIGGGDTGSDCIGTSIRQGALSVTNFEILPAPPLHENKMLTWPNWPLKLRTSSSHEEGAERDFAVMTSRFSGAQGFVKKLHCVHVDDKLKTIPGSEFEIEAELVLLAMGFMHPVHEGMIKELNPALDQRGNIVASTGDYRTSIDKVFAAGDMRRGQSLVVWAIREGRQAAHAVDAYLMGSSLLPR